MFCERPRISRNRRRKGELELSSSLPAHAAAKTHDALQMRKKHLDLLLPRCAMRLGRGGVMAQMASRVSQGAARNFSVRRRLQHSVSAWTGPYWHASDGADRQCPRLRRDELRFRHKKHARRFEGRYCGPGSARCGPGERRMIAGNLPRSQSVKPRIGQNALHLERILRLMTMKDRMLLRLRRQAL